MRQVRLLGLALGFLSRLAPARSATREDMSAACLYYPFVGALLGVVATLPFFLGLFAGQPLLQGWLFVLWLTWLTRALHLDGLADVLDALGSGKNAEGFQAVLKDSRVGTFGVVGLIFVIAGQSACVAACLEHARLLPLMYAPLFGRCLPIFLSCLAQPHPKAGLGGLLAGAPKRSSVTVALTALFLGGPASLEPGAFLLCLLLGGGLLLFLARVAHRQGGYNGDFFGFAIVAGEWGVLLAAVPGLS